jgi:N-acetylglucosamine kinase-like BadF-type ATPase
MIIALDGGGSKTDAVALDLEGRLIARAAGPSSSPQAMGLEQSLSVVDSLVSQLRAAAPRHESVQLNLYLSGLDLPEEIESYAEGVRGYSWAAGSTGNPTIVDNDMYALLRSGTDEPNAAAVVCGTGINAIGVREDGRQARFPALGMLTGDWGGGYDLGNHALWHAARAIDGRGGPTLFTESIPKAVGLPDLRSVIEAIHFGRLPGSVLATFAPLVLEAAAQGDPAAIGIVDRQAEEIVALAVAALGRLDLLGTAVPVVLGGGVLAAGDARLLGGVERLLATGAPLARIEFVASRPILGAALLTLETVGASADAIALAHEELR